jgi:tetratricopeptide (TPR) repeat protein
MPSPRRCVAQKLDAPGADDVIAHRARARNGATTLKQRGIAYGPFVQARRRAGLDAARVRARGGRSRCTNSPTSVEPARGRRDMTMHRIDAMAWRGAACLLVIAALALGAAHAQHAHDEQAVVQGAEIGAVDFRADCRIEVRDRVDRALGLMHHMMYEQARAVFSEVAEEDPSCAMAHWGVATTLFQPLWSDRPNPEALQRGFVATEQARAVVASDREARLIAATGAFFRDPDSADYWARIERWADGMRVAYEAFPDDLDTAALYALSRIALAPIAEDRAAVFDEAEVVLQRVFHASPTHPGAIHYAIHATDVDGRAVRALDRVAVYGDIAPQVPHALHMPTHIYVRLGAWLEVIAWNRRSADAALAAPVGDRVSLHHIHALDYMLYAALQRGDDDFAQEVLDEALGTDRYQDGFPAAFHLAIMPARFAVERRAWHEAATLDLEVHPYLTWDRYAWPQATLWFARGLGAAHSGAFEEAREAEARMAALRDRSADAGERELVAFIEIDRLVLAGAIARSDGDDEGAIALLEQAAALEGSVEKHPVTPGALLPPYEALGDLFLELGRHAEAQAAYEASDRRWPGRYNTLLGVMRSVLETDETAARLIAERLLAQAGALTRATVAEAYHVMARISR